ncbi:hypothetical protein QWJ41_19640 [Nocardioides sp. SOB44]|uniref:DUF2142 domain-containing protein n=1 Tax=Nocardioides cremeus TaxID=3058044 RepID=A0ABT8TVF6_9ACTN|nr:hypothetical protein [Nocardioides cremeus]MDO3397945.1 hypothetical protein [Nocardioides cremeus]
MTQFPKTEEYGSESKRIETSQKGRHAPLVALLFSLVFIAAVFPPVNWPDERRNLMLLETGDYGWLYAVGQSALREAVSGFYLVGPFDRVTWGVGQNVDWRYGDGSLRYLTQPLAAPLSYYVAKATNIVIVVAAILGFRLAMGLTQSRRDQLNLYVLSLLLPAASYQLLQVSTDLTFILLSMGLYFITQTKLKIVFAVICCLLTVEDRSFAILACIALAYAAAPKVLLWRKIHHRRALRLALLFGASVIGVVLGRLVASIVLDGGGLLAGFLADPSSLTSASETLAYTRAKGYNLAQSPVLLYAGLAYLPGATEYFVLLIPFYIIALPVFWRLLVFATSRTDELGERAFYLVLSTVVVFFGMTTALHVFEHGRYYFTLAPLLVLALASIFAPRGVQVGAYLRDSTTIQRVTAALFTLNVVLTSAVGIPQLV